jgi:acetyl esterase/lipase
LSADYALLPDLNGNDILQDVKDLFSFLREDPRFDATRIGVLGSSAGCYIALLAGIYLQPRALGLMWGMGIFLQDDFWFKQHSTPPAGIAHLPPDHDFATYLKEGNMLDGLTGQTGLGSILRAASASTRAGLVSSDSLFPELLLNSSFPPTALIHGTGDTVVPYEESVWLSKHLEALGVVVQLELVEGAEHGLKGAFKVQDKRERHADFVLGRL